MIPEHPTPITAKTLLQLYLELWSLSASSEAWSEAAFRDNPPRLYRLRQLQALLRAFGIDTPLADFAEGHFIRHARPGYRDLLDRVQAEMAHELGLVDPVWLEPGAPEPEQLAAAFSILLEYRLLLEDAFSFPRRSLAATGLPYYAYQRIRALNRAIQAQVALLDELLATLIDPEERVFDQAALVQTYGYPEVDLAEIDAEWW